MATESDILKVLYDWLFGILSIPVVKTQQPEQGQSTSAPQPTGTYATFEISTGPKRVGIADEKR